MLVASLFSVSCSSSKKCSLDNECKTGSYCSEDNKCVNFVYVKCGLDDETPRPPLDVVKVKKFN